MGNAKNEFNRFLRTERSAAANAYVSGDAELVKRLSVSAGPATFLGPGGGVLSGAEKVNRVNAKGSKSFRAGGKSSFKIVHAAASDGLAFWTGLQRANVRIAGKPGRTSMVLRVTEVFKKEKRGWKMIHRHADMLAKPGKGSR